MGSWASRSHGKHARRGGAGCRAEQRLRTDTAAKAPRGRVPPVFLRSSGEGSSVHPFANRDSPRKTTASHFPAFISRPLICQVGLCTGCGPVVKPARGDQRGPGTAAQGQAGPGSTAGDRSGAVALSLRAHTHMCVHTHGDTQRNTNTVYGQPP